MPRDFDGTALAVQQYLDIHSPERGDIVDFLNSVQAADFTVKRERMGDEENADIKALQTVALQIALKRYRQY